MQIQDEALLRRRAEPIREPLQSHFGNMTLQLYPPLIKQDFYQQYHQPTFWPYCESLEECVVYRQAHDDRRQSAMLASC